MSYDCGGDHVWLHGQQKDLPVMISHYQDCKARSPGDTSACMLVPRFLAAKLLLPPHMQLLRSYPKGTRLMTAVGVDGRRSAIPLKYAADVRVWSITS
jgi:hypothetical protein